MVVCECQYVCVCTFPVPTPLPLAHKAEMLEALPPWSSMVIGGCHRLPLTNNFEPKKLLSVNRK